jgi:hypothetical protein
MRHRCIPAQEALIMTGVLITANRNSKFTANSNGSEQADVAATL